MIKTSAIKPNPRNQQRVDVATNVRIEKLDGSSLVCSVYNISRTGIMISCGQEDAESLMPGQQLPPPGTWIEVKVSFSVPVSASEPVPVLAHGHIVHLRRVSRHEFQIGLQFTEFDDDGFEYVDRYVSQFLAAATT